MLINPSQKNWWKPWLISDLSIAWFHFPGRCSFCISLVLHLGITAMTSSWVCWTASFCMVSALCNSKVFHSLFLASFYGPMIVAGSHFLTWPGLTPSQYEQLHVLSYFGVYHMTLSFSFVCLYVSMCDAVWVCACVYQHMCRCTYTCMCKTEANIVFLSQSLSILHFGMVFH